MLINIFICFQDLDCFPLGRQLTRECLQKLSTSQTSPCENGYYLEESGGTFQCSLNDLCGKNTVTVAQMRTPLTVNNSDSNKSLLKCACQNKAVSTSLLLHIPSEETVFHNFIPAVYVFRNVRIIDV